ncbi:MAG: hypothetical protein JSU82_05675 [Rhodospirillales bacterium]|nr:MAG: hypothetical protein JSU82_05675 [Rhodospirillales bacterium]
MSRLLLISLGQLTGHILDSVARTGAFAEIVVAGRNPTYGIARTNLARIGAGIEGRFPSIEFRELDINRTGAAAEIRRIAPDVALAAPSMLPWWKLDRLSGRRGEAARQVPFAGWLACHLAPMLAVRRAWAESGLDAPWVGASYPDVVNAILHRTGPGPGCGVGNVDEIVPKIRMVLAAATGHEPETVEVRLVAQHALEYFAYRDGGAAAGEMPPFLITASAAGRDLSALAREAISQPWPIPYDRDFNRLTASSAAVLLPALAGRSAVRMHVPAPAGLIGGYPVRIAARRVTLDLAPEWRQDEAVASNLAALPWDGLETIENDGAAVFTAATTRALHALLGRAVEGLHPDDAPALAEDLLAAVDAG